MLTNRNYQVNTNNQQTYRPGMLALACPFEGVEFKENSIIDSYYVNLME